MYISHYDKYQKIFIIINQNQNVDDSTPWYEHNIVYTYYDLETVKNDVTSFEIRDRKNRVLRLNNAIPSSNLDVIFQPNLNVSVFFVHSTYMASYVNVEQLVKFDLICKLSRKIYYCTK